MAWEQTIVCDGCSEIVCAGGTSRQALQDLFDQGGSMIRGDVAGDWQERHLCASCARTKTTYYDGASIPGRHSVATKEIQSSEERS